MPNKDINKYNNEPEQDAFYDYFRNHLEKHELPVDEESWTKISMQLHIPKKNELIFSRYSVIAAAILLLIFFVGLLYLSKTNKTGASGMSEELILADKVVGKREFSLQQDTMVNVPQIRKSRKSSERKEKNSIVIRKRERIGKDIDGGKDLREEENDQIVSIFDNRERQNRDVIEDGITNKMNSLRKKQKNYEDYFVNSSNDVTLLKLSKSKRSGWALVAAVSVSGSNSKLQNNNLIMADNSFIVQGEGFDYTLLETYRSNDVSDVKYEVPFSIGLLVSKRIKNSIRVETGITYSYLATKYKDSEGKLYSATTQLHYIGIPVNLGFDLLNINSRWKIYGNSGFTIEKGIRNNFTQELFGGKARTRERRNISGFQWSLNLSAGISYRFYDNINIYSEPRLSYFLDNNQPISIRTEKKCIFSLNAGIRYQF